MAGHNPTGYTVGVPFKSAKQRRFLFAKKPKIARKFAAHGRKRKRKGGRSGY